MVAQTRLGLGGGALVVVGFGRLVVLVTDNYSLRIRRVGRAN